MGCCGSSATSGGVISAPPPQQTAHQGQQQFSQPSTTATTQQRPASTRKSLTKAAPQGSAQQIEAAPGSVPKANAEYRTGLSFSDEFFAAYECCVVDNAIKQLVFRKLVGDEDNKGSDLTRKLDLPQGKITYIAQGGNFEFRTEFQPIIFIEGNTTRFAPVSKQKDEIADSMEQFTLIYDTLLTIFPKATELTMQEKTWASSMEANTFGHMISMMFAYAMGPLFTQAVVHLSDATMFYCHKSHLMLYTPEQTAEDTLGLLSKGFAEIRCLPLDATTVINGWFRIAGSHGVQVTGAQLSAVNVKKYLDLAGISEMYAETYATWDWTLYNIKLGDFKKEIRLLVRPRPDGTSTIEVILTIES